MGEDLKYGAFFGFGFGAVEAAMAVFIAWHGEPVFDVVGNEAEGGCNSRCGKKEEACEEEEVG